MRELASARSKTRSSQLAGEITKRMGRPVSKNLFRVARRNPNHISTSRLITLDEEVKRQNRLGDRTLDLPHIGSRYQS
jgi:hypothetical protein